jgi:hypothetical protein
MVQLMAILLVLPVAQRVGIRTGGGAAWVGSQTYNPGLEKAPALSIGQGGIVSSGMCLLKLNADGGPDYTAPMALNRTNRWMLIQNSFGGRQLQWVGQPTATYNALGQMTGCSVPVATPANIPDIPSGVDNNAAYWSVSEDYVAYYLANPSRLNQILYRHRCTANCEFASATWVWEAIRTFTAADIDWNNVTFCESNCVAGPGGWTRVSDFEAVKLWMSSYPQDRLIFSLRGGTKSEYGACVYTFGDDTMRCRYLGQNKSLPASATPQPPTPDFIGNGAFAPYSFVDQNVLWYQMNASNPGNSYPLIYAMPLPTAATQNFEGAYSVTGLEILMHGATTSTGLCTVSTRGGWAGYYGQMPQQIITPNWTYSYLCYDNAGTRPATGQPVSSRTVLFMPQGMYQNGWHASSSPNPARQKWQAMTFYRDEVYNFPSAGTLGEEIVLVDVSSPSLPYPNYPAALPQPTLIRLGPHFSKCIPCNTTPGYPRQGHANVNWDGSLVVFKSTMTGGWNGSGDTRATYGTYAYWIPGVSW